MQRRPTDLNIAGAVDLSSLRAPAPAAAAAGAPTASTSAHVLDVTEATFETEVLQRSMTVPVLIDFWADWCGPCKQLSPVLERLAEADGGSWVLAKIDVDANQALSGQLGIQSIPTVLLALGGRLVQGFTGALPERDVRSFLDQVLAAAQQAGLPGPGGDPEAGPQGPPADPELVAAEEAIATDDLDAAAAAYDALLARKPGDPVAIGGRAWVELIRRTEGLDPQAVLDRASAAPPTSTPRCPPPTSRCWPTAWSRPSPGSSRWCASAPVTSASGCARTCWACSACSTRRTRASSPAAGRWRTPCSSRPARCRRAAAARCARGRCSTA